MLLPPASLLHPVPLTLHLPRSSQDRFRSSSWLDSVVCTFEYLLPSCLTIPRGLKVGALSSVAECAGILSL